MKKTYAYIYNWKSGKKLEIGGTEDQVSKDLRDMEVAGIIDDNCEIRRYKVEIPELK